MTPKTSSPKPCYLLNLPAELRNYIFHYALVDDDHILDVDAPSFRIPGLLSTNRQIRKETTKLYFGQNTFLFPCSQRRHQDLLSAIPDKTIRLMHTLILDFCPGTITFFTGESSYTNVAFGRPEDFWEEEDAEVCAFTKWMRWGEGEEWVREVFWGVGWGQELGREEVVRVVGGFFGWRGERWGGDERGDGVGWGRGW